VQLPKHLTNPDPNIYLSNNYVVFDVETTNLEKGDALNVDNRLLIVTWKQYNKPTQIAWWNEYQIPEWFYSLLEDSDFIVAHNAKFDLAWMLRAGINLTKLVVWDTQIAEYVIAGNRKMPLSLDACLDRRGFPMKDSFISKSIKAGICPSDLPKSVLGKYAKNDTAYTEKLFLHQREQIFDSDLHRTMYTHCLFTVPLVDIEAQGMALDHRRVKLLHNKLKEEYDQLVQEFNEFSDGVNFKSPKQVGEFIYDVLGFEEPTDRKGEPIRTGAGGRKTDIATLQNLKARTKDQKKFIALQEKLTDLNAKLTKALTKMMECVEENAGVLHGQFNQTITQTHRLSSNGKRYKIQFQNMLRDFKPLFSAKHDGWLMGEVDGAQLEFRIAAWYGQDEVATEDIKNGFDVHQYTSDTITAAGQKTDRQGAKAHTFKPLFGGSSGTKAEQAYYKAFRAKYPGIDAAQNAWITEVLKTKQLVLPTGMVFYWPSTKMDRSGYVTNTTAISNYPIQYLATGEIIPIAVTYLWHRMTAKKMESKIVNTIHDSAIAEIHPQEAELYEELAVQSFTSDVYKYLLDVYNIDFNVPLEAEVELNEYWADKPDWEEKWL